MIEPYLFGPEYKNSINNPQIMCVVELKTSPRCAPSVLILFINMMLFKPGAPFEGCDEFMFPNQVRTSVIKRSHSRASIIIIALISMYPED